MIRQVAFYLESNTLFTSAISSGKTVKRSPTIPKSAAEIIEASESLLIATTRSFEDIPIRFEK
jgi:hypothetical protein